MESDNEGEYCDGRFEKFSVSQGIYKVKMILRNPHQNGVVKRMNRTILEYSRSVQIHVRLSKQFLADTINTMIYLINREPLVSLNCGILKEAWTGKEVNLNHLRTFDCILYVQVNLDHMSKLDPKSKSASSLGMIQASVTIDFGIQKTKRSLGIRMWYSMMRRYIKTS